MLRHGPKTPRIFWPINEEHAHRKHDTPFARDRGHIRTVRHLVTGGSGFLGSAIARRLIERGDEVRILDVWEDEGRASEAEFVRCDILDREGVAAAMRGVDVVHHNVALVPITKSGDRFWTVNVEGTRIAAEEAVRAGASAFVHMSSSAIFGRPAANPILPDAVPHPIEKYGRAKLASETAARTACEAAGLPLTIIRPRTILGPGRLGIFGILFDWIREGRNVYTIGDGNVRFQFVHAQDLIDAYILTLDRGRPGTYNVGTDRFGTMRQALEGVIRHAGSSSKVVGIPPALVINALRAADWLKVSPLGPYHYHAYGSEYFFDVSPLLALGWKPRYSNDEMFAESYDWFTSHRDEIMASRTGSVHRRPVREKILSVVRRFS